MHDHYLHYQKGDVVRVALHPSDKDKRWTKAEVEKEVSIRSYEVKVEGGQVYCRNRRHLRVSKEPYHQTEGNTEPTLAVAEETITEENVRPQSATVDSTKNVLYRENPESAPRETLSKKCRGDQQ
jgi:hypothetical protein